MKRIADNTKRLAKTNQNCTNHGTKSTETKLYCKTIIEYAENKTIETLKGANDDETAKKR